MQTPRLAKTKLIMMRPEASTNLSDMRLWAIKIAVQIRAPPEPKLVITKPNFIACFILIKQDFIVKMQPQLSVRTKRQIKKPSLNAELQPKIPTLSKAHL